jgi:arsenite methyltransferase
MASTCPVDLDTLRLCAEIESIYRRVAMEPSGEFHFHRGPTYAAEMLGYDAVRISASPQITVSDRDFEGVSDTGRRSTCRPTSYPAALTFEARPRQDSAA